MKILNFWLEARMDDKIGFFLLETCPRLNICGYPFEVVMNEKNWVVSRGHVKYV